VSLLDRRRQAELARLVDTEISISVDTTGAHLRLQARAHQDAAYSRSRTSAASITAGSPRRSRRGSRTSPRPSPSARPLGRAGVEDFAIVAYHRAGRRAFSDRPTARRRATSAALDLLDGIAGTVVRRYELRLLVALAPCSSGRRTARIPGRGGLRARPSSAIASATRGCHTVASGLLLFHQSRAELATCISSQATARAGARMATALEMLVYENLGARLLGRPAYAIVAAAGTGVLRARGRRRLRLTCRTTRRS
jgi:hypothetical protein